MQRLTGLVVNVVFSAFVMALTAPLPSMAQEKAKAEKKMAKAEKGKPALKEYFENDKVRVLQATFKPGDVGSNVARPQRVVHTLKGGTLTRVYPDGKTEKVVYKTGEVKVLEASPVFQPKNEGKSDIVFFLVFMKEPKK